MRFACDSCNAQYMISEEKVGPKGVKVRCKKCGHVIVVRKGGGLDDIAGAPLDEDTTATQVMQNPLDSPAATLPTDGTDRTNTGAMPFESEERTAAGIFGDLDQPDPPKAPKLPKRDDPDKLLGSLDEDELGAVFDSALKSKPNDASGAGGGPSVGDDSDRQSTRVVDVGLLKKLADQTSNEPVLPPPPAAPEAPQNDWFVAINDEQQGPMTLDSLKEHWDKGEIGPDALCWREGMDDWVAVSSVPSLAAVLAPRPKKPVIMAPGVHGGQVVAASGDASGHAPVVAASNEGGTALGSGGREETGVWKPAAASALAALVKEESEAMTAAPPAKRYDPPAPADAKSLLDLPPAPTGETAARPGPSPLVTSFEGVSALPPAHVYGVPSTPALPGQNRMLLVLVGGGAAVIMLLFAVVLYLVFRTPGQPVAAATAPAPAAAAPTPVVIPPPPPPAVAPTPTPVAAAPTDAKPADAAAAPAPAAAPAANAPKAPPPVVAAAKPTGSGSGHSTGSGKGSRSSEGGESAPVAAKPSAAADDDDFSKAFGGASTKPPKAAVEDRPASEKPAKKSAGYIPPAPGDSSIKDDLSPVDVMSVVKDHLSEIQNCKNEQKAKDPNLHGSLKMRWKVQTSGKTSNVAVAPDSEVKGDAAIAGCIGGLVRTWVFPKHRNEGPPIDFPFKF